MAKQTTNATQDLRNLFDPQGYQDLVKTWAGYNERLTSIFVEAATKSTDIASQSAQETFSNVRGVATVRDEPRDYAQAYSDFVQKQMDLLMRTMQSFGEVTQKAGSETTDLATAAGEEMGQKIGANAEEAADKATSAAKKAA